MEGFDAISKKYSSAGVCLDNIEYAVTAIKFGSSPAQIVENLKVGYKSMNEDLANAMLKDLIIANQVEQKKKKRNGLALGMVYLLAGFVSTYYILHVLIFGGVLHRPVFMILVAIIGTAIGLINFTKSFKTDTEKFTHEFAHK